MDTLEEWLASTVNSDLGHVLQWLLDNSNRDNARGTTGKLDFEDDGTYLRVKSKRVGTAQIAKWSPTLLPAPVKVTLSDSHTRINAVIAEAASRAYLKKARRRVTDGTLGGLMQIEDFEIVATHAGPRADRLSLLVKDFRILGSEGSGPFGNAPRPIESIDQEEFGLQVKLKSFRELQKNTSQASTQDQPSNQALSFQSQASNRSELELEESSQQAFATQMPYPGDAIPARSVARSGALAFNPQDSGLDQPTVIHDSTDIMTANGKQTVRPLELTTPEAAPQISKVVPAKKSAAHDAPLLRFAARQQGKKPRQESSANEGLKKLPPGALGTADTQSFKASSDVAPSREAGVDVHVPSSVPMTTDRSNERSLPSISASIAPVTVLADAGPSTEDPVVIPLEASPKETRPLSNQRKVRDPISSKNVRIPRDQETLLNRTDSWLPAEPGQREPYANVPLPTLKLLNKEADDRANMQLAQGQSYPHKGIINIEEKHAPVTSQSMNTQDSESDKPVSTAQWPPSPDRNALPPDSSMPSVEHSDPGTTTRSNHRSANYSRRPSHASTSSRNLVSNGVKSGRSQGSSISSSEPDLSFGSPSIVSNSAGEEIRRWRCQLCNKSYKNSGSLKYHVNRHHKNDAAPMKRFDCPKEGCTKSYRAKSGLRNHVDLHHQAAKSSLSNNRGSASRSSQSGTTTPTFPNSKTYEAYGEDSLHPSKRRRVSGQASENRSLPENVQKVFSSRNDNQTEQIHGSLAEVTPVSPTNSPKKDNIAPQSTATASDHRIQDMNTVSITSSPTESDLEMTVPLPLGETKASDINSAPMQRSPSLASQSEEPFTQVKQTPYRNEYKQDLTLTSQDRLVSPSRQTASSSLDTSIASRTHVTVSDLAVSESTSTAPEVTRQIAFEDQAEQSVPKAADHAMATDHTMVVDNSDRDGALEVPDLIDIASQNNQKTNPFNRPKSTERPDLNSRRNMPLSPLTNHKESDIEPQTEDSDLVKRKAPDSNLSSPRSAKRPKFLLDFLPQQYAPDPHILARRNRQEFFSRRSSESSTPRESPISPPKGRRGTVALGTFPSSPNQKGRLFRPTEQVMLSEAKVVEDVNRIDFAEEGSTFPKLDWNEIVEAASAPQVVEISRADEGKITGTGPTAPIFNATDMLDTLDVGVGAQEVPIAITEAAVSPSNDAAHPEAALSVVQNVETTPEDSQSLSHPAVEKINEAEAASSTVHEEDVAELLSTIDVDQTEVQSPKDSRELSVVIHDQEDEAGPKSKVLAVPFEQCTTPSDSSHKNTDHTENDPQVAPNERASYTSDVLQDFELPMPQDSLPGEVSKVEEIVAPLRPNDTLPELPEETPSPVQMNPPLSPQSLLAKAVDVEDVAEPSNDVSLGQNQMEKDNTLPSSLQELLVGNQSNGNRSVTDRPNDNMPAYPVESSSVNMSVPFEGPSHEISGTSEVNEDSNMCLPANEPSLGVPEISEKTPYPEAPLSVDLTLKNASERPMEIRSPKDASSDGIQTPGDLNEELPQMSNKDDSSRAQARAEPFLRHSPLTQDRSPRSRSPDQLQAPNHTAAFEQEEMAAQKILMKEKREAAIKRRKEDEIREEAARKERIRKKMESLEMEPLSKEELPMKITEVKQIQNPNNDHRYSASRGEEAVNGSPMPQPLNQIVEPPEENDSNGFPIPADHVTDHVSEVATGNNRADLPSPSPLQPAKLVELPELSKQTLVKPAQTIFNCFKTTYTDYAGDMKHFLARCKKIKLLLDDDRMEHPSLWDDFIIRHHTDYGPYIRRCAEEGDDSVPYEKFYRQMIEDPKYTGRIVNMRNISDILGITDGNASAVLEDRSSKSGPSPQMWRESMFSDEPRRKNIDSFHSQKTSISTEQQSPKNLSYIDSRKEAVQAGEVPLQLVSSMLRRKGAESLDHPRHNDRSPLSVSSPFKGTPLSQRDKTSSPDFELSSNRAWPKEKSPSHLRSDCSMRDQREPQDVLCSPEVLSPKGSVPEKQHMKAASAPRQDSNSEGKRRSEEVIDLTGDDDVTELKNPFQSKPALSKSAKKFTKYTSISPRRSLPWDGLGSQTTGTSSFTPFGSALNKRSQYLPKSKRVDIEAAHRSSVSSENTDRSRQKTKDFLDNFRVSSANSHRSSPLSVAESRQVREESVELGQLDSDYAGHTRHSVQPSQGPTPGGAFIARDSQNRSSPQNEGVTKAQETRDLKESYISSIRQHWGVRPEGLLESQFYAKESLPLKSLKVMSDISSELSVTEARRLIMDRIGKRTQENPRTSVNSDQTIVSKLTHKDLEQVKLMANTGLTEDDARRRSRPQTTENPSMRISSPLDLTHTDAVVEMQDQEAPTEWWHDNDTPFKTFIRNYISIQPGRCNSYASPTDVKFGEKAHRQSRGRMKKLDILGWQI